jgi:hypothetical protein
MEDLEKIKFLEKEIELLKEIIRLKDENKLASPPVIIPQPYPVYPPILYPPSYTGDWPFTHTRCGSTININ